MIALTRWTNGAVALGAIALALFVGAFTCQAQPDERTLIEAASRSLDQGAVEIADQQLDEFLSLFPNSPRVPEAILYKARAAVQQQKFESAINLLSTNIAKAGVITDRYHYWLGEAHFRSSNYVAAVETFARVVRDFPESPRLLSAAYGEALARFRLKEFYKVLDLLQNPEGAFQRAAYERRTDPFAVRGQLLLVEGYLELGDDVGAERALSKLADRKLTPEQLWRRDYLLCRIELFRKRYASALVLASNLTVSAPAADQPIVKAAESVALHGNILEQAGEIDSAIQVYTNNLGALIPPGHRRSAFLRIIELTLAQSRLTEAAQELERFFAQYPGDAASDVALLTLGELHLKQHWQAVEGNRTNLNFVVPTNFLYDALSRFERVRTTFPQSPFLGLAHLNRGWCYWEQGNLAESQLAFKAATEQLQSPEHLAVARFKLGDTYFRQGDYTNAIANYRRAMQDSLGIPPLYEKLCGQALYQIVRADLQAGLTREAEETLSKLLKEFPDQLYGHRGLLLFAQGLMRGAQPAEARKAFAAFSERTKNSPLSAEVDLAIARSYVEEKDWDAAMRYYDEWIDRHRTNALREKVEFDRAWVRYLAGQETNALTLFTNFIARFPGNSLVTKAQFWVADFYLRHGNYTNAELAYQNTNLVNSPNGYQARLMAGSAAFARHEYKFAADYFRSLVVDENCPQEIASEALFALGDSILLGEGNAADPIRKFDEAKEAYRRITVRYPESRLVPLAHGQIGNCYFQMAAIDSKFYTNALDSYGMVLALTNHTSVAARSQAEFGIGQVLERQAKGPPEKPDLLKGALRHYLNVFNAKNLSSNESADRVWTREAGFAAARLAEELKEWELALNIYLSLRDLAPASRDSLDRKIARLREQVPADKG